MRLSLLFLLLSAQFVFPVSKRIFQVTGVPEIPSEVLPLGNTDSVKTMNGIAFSPDQKKLYVSWVITRERNANGKYRTRIFEYENVAGHFINPKLISFSGKYIDYHPVLSADGKRMFFNSLRPLPGDTAELVKNNIWYSDLVDDKWGEPKLLSATNTEHYDSYPSLAKNGNLYFISDRPGGKGSDIYFSRYQNEKYTAPENLSTINGENGENDVVIDPNEKFIIFNVYEDATKQIKMYISFNNNGQWKKQKLVKGIDQSDPTVWNLNPALSPDGKWFLYERKSRIQRVPLEKILE